VVKVHGTVEAPESMVDTLQQRVRGRPEALNGALQRLMVRYASTEELSRYWGEVVEESRS
jgi:hypothetical protein